MAHMIENNEMAYVGARPWHGLGALVAAGATGAEMLKAAGLEWKIELRDLAFMLPGNSGEMVDPLTNFKAITRSDNDKVFQVATKYYNPVQNDEIVDFFREYCEAGHASMETVGALKGGAIVWALAKLNGGSSATLAGNDELRGYMLLATSHDSTMTTIARATQVRVVCWNTLSAALRKNSTEKQFRVSHSRKWTETVAQEARDNMGMASERISRTNEIAAQLSQVQIDEKGRIEFLTRLIGGESVLDQAITTTKESALDAALRQHEVAKKDKKVEESAVGKKILEAMLNSPGADLLSAKNTLWGAVNGVTYYSDHERGKSQDSRMAASWFGEGERLKNDALSVAMQMAGASL